MRRSIFGAMVLAAAAAVAMCGGSDSPTGPSNTGPMVFTATLSGANEVPPITEHRSQWTGHCNGDDKRSSRRLRQPDRRWHRQLLRSAVGSARRDHRSFSVTSTRPRLVSMAACVVNTGLTAGRRLPCWMVMAPGTWCSTIGRLAPAWRNGFTPTRPAST